MVTRRQADRIISILALVEVLVLLGGCSNPTAPSMQTCTTQPRWYGSADGTRWWQEIDTYQAVQCPKVPIK